MWFCCLWVFFFFLSSQDMDALWHSRVPCTRSYTKQRPWESCGLVGPRNSYIWDVVRVSDNDYYITAILCDTGFFTSSVYNFQNSKFGLNLLLIYQFHFCLRRKDLGSCTKHISLFLQGFFSFLCLLGSFVGFFGVFFYLRVFFNSCSFPYLFWKFRFSWSLDFYP